MTVKYIQRTIDKQDTFFIGYYEDITDLIKHRGVGMLLFGDIKRAMRTFNRQGFVSFLSDATQIEYRIEEGKL
jgi:hypothetical protein